MYTVDLDSKQKVDINIFYSDDAINTGSCFHLNSPKPVLFLLRVENIGLNPPTRPWDQFCRVLELACDAPYLCPWQNVS